MGRILTIRLSAVTYNEEDVFRAWPALCALAWPGQGDRASVGWRPKPTLFAPPGAPEAKRRGVQDLARDFLEEFHFGDMEDGMKARLKSGTAELEKAIASLEKNLEDWQPQAANTASNAVEDALDTLEKQAAE